MSKWFSHRVALRSLGMVLLVASAVVLLAPVPGLGATENRACEGGWCCYEAASICFAGSQIQYDNYYCDGVFECVECP